MTKCQVDLLPRAEWSAAEVTHGLSDAVQCLLSCVTVRGKIVNEFSVPVRVVRFAGVGDME